MAGILAAARLPGVGRVGAACLASRGGRMVAGVRIGGGRIGREGGRRCEQRAAQQDAGDDGQTVVLRCTMRHGFPPR